MLLSCDNAHANNIASMFKEFVTEKQIEEVKKKGQEEWEKVRLCILQSVDFHIMNIQYKWKYVHVYDI